MKAHAARSEPGIGGRGAMERQGGLAADEAGRAELERLGRSAARREADRARAVLWSLEGETSPTIAARLGVRAEQVRRWRAAFRRGGVEAPGRASQRALLGVLDHASRELIVSTSGTERSADFIAPLMRLDRAYGPTPGREDPPVVLVLDNGPIHTSRASRRALAARPR